MDDGSGGSGRAENDTRSGESAVVMGEAVSMRHSMALQLGHRKTEEREDTHCSLNNPTGPTVYILL